MQSPPGGQAGHSLGGSVGPASPDDVRKRRLAALQSSSSSSSTSMKKETDEDNNATSSPSSPTRSAPMLRFLSSSPATAVTTTATTTTTTTTAAWDLTAFQAIMWDASMTTEQDKQRWVNQGIGMRRDSDCAMDETLSTGPPGTTPTTVAAAVPNQDDDTRRGVPTFIHHQPPPPLQAIHSSSADAVALSEKLQQLEMSHIPWGLMQHHGGPCGVLAAIQAELLRIMWYHHNDDDSTTGTTTRVVVSPEIALAHAMAEILVRVATTPPAYYLADTTNHDDDAVISSASPLSLSLSPVVRIVLPNPANTSWHQFLLSNQSTAVNVHMFHKDRSGISGHHGDDWENSIKTFLLDHLAVYRDIGGVLLLVMSLVATRTPQVIVQEFDDTVGTKLTGQFGHCAQELINLLLTGQAVSNVFDNTLSPSGDMVCRGIPARPNIGYLSQLEALRYCEVGSYYKSPKVPIWVVGSTSHFTVLFGEAAALEESQSDLILEECRRAFKSMEGGEENGFIQASRLGEILWKLKIDLGSDAESKTQTLASSMEVGGGAGIILWDDFWKVAGRLMTGATLESILGAGTSTDPITVDDLAIHPTTTAATSQPAARGGSIVETDEEMARRLNAEWSSNDGLSGLNVLSSAAAAVVSSDSDTMQVEPSPGMTDEEYARVLQAAYDYPSNASVGAVQGDTTEADDDLSNTVADNTSNIEVENTSLLGNDDFEDGVDVAGKPMNMEIEDLEDSKPAAVPKRTHSFEEFGQSFSLYHYNGLRGGVLTPFKVTRLSSQEAIGSSVALNRGGTAGGGSSSGQDLEDVVRTKWPSCNVDWLGGRAPFID